MQKIHSQATAAGYVAGIKSMTKEPNFMRNAIVGAVVAVLALKILR